MNVLTLLKVFDSGWDLLGSIFSSFLLSDCSFSLIFTLTFDLDCGPPDLLFLRRRDPFLVRARRLGWFRLRRVSFLLHSSFLVLDLSLGYSLCKLVHISLSL